MNRDVATAEARGFDMLAVANGKLRIGPTANELIAVVGGDMARTHPRHRKTICP